MEIIPHRKDSGGSPPEYRTETRTDADHDDIPPCVAFQIDRDTAFEIVRLAEIVKARGLYKVEKFDYRARWTDENDEQISMDAETLNVTGKDFWFSGYIKHTNVEVLSARQRIADLAQHFNLQTSPDQDSPKP
ncbi:hypothetical protein [Caballeronia sp. LZ001]|uniref:hypothetical protein n=1 Tax=Caballeronia sp. LZ001 TaxID=3038553 RepID=UPI00285FF14E|nr:hypothetical protein [Caballeronia sp. LZ001]MDR5804919.1 hypothetical protein [Caballeronia sp. LZ001]